MAKKARIVGIAVIAVGLLITLAPKAAWAQTGVLYVQDNKVGIGTDAPINVLHVKGGTLRIERDDGVTPNMRFYTSGGGVTQSWLFQNNSASGVFAIRDETAGNSPFRVYPGGAESTLTVRSGRVGVGTSNPLGTLDVNGPIYQRGTSLHADYVFQSDYKLESIADHAAFMWTNHHLPAVPEAKTDTDGMEVVNVGAHRQGMLEELEKAHIYIDQLNQRLTDKDQQIDALAQRIERLEKRVSHQ